MKFTAIVWVLRKSGGRQPVGTGCGDRFDDGPGTAVSVDGMLGHLTRKRLDGQGGPLGSHDVPEPVTIDLHTWAWAARACGLSDAGQGDAVLRIDRQRLGERVEGVVQALHANEDTPQEQVSAKPCAQGNGFASVSAAASKFPL